MDKNLSKSLIAVTIAAPVLVGCSPASPLDS
jgi:hypothetical protein